MYFNFGICKRSLQSSFTNDLKKNKEAYQRIDSHLQRKYAFLMSHLNCTALIVIDLHLIIYF